MNSIRSAWHARGQGFESPQLHTGPQGRGGADKFVPPPPGQRRCGFPTARPQGWSRSQGRRASRPRRVHSRRRQSLDLGPRRVRLATFDDIIDAWFADGCPTARHPRDPVMPVRRQRTHPERESRSSAPGRLGGLGVRLTEQNLGTGVAPQPTVSPRTGAPMQQSVVTGVQRRPGVGGASHPRVRHPAVQVYGLFGIFRRLVLRVPCGHRTCRILSVAAWRL